VLDISFSAIAAAVLAVGAVWIGLGLAGVVRPVRATIVIGSLIALISAQLFVIDAEAPVLGLLTAAGLVGLALHRRDLLVLGIGSIGILLTLPIVIYEWFPSVAAAAISLLVVGGFLVGAAVYTARRKTVGSTPR
jgi:hypothetical protein